MKIKYSFFGNVINQIQTSPTIRMIHRSEFQTTRELPQSHFLPSCDFHIRYQMPPIVQILDSRNRIIDILVRKYMKRKSKWNKVGDALLLLWRLLVHVEVDGVASWW